MQSSDAVTEADIDLICAANCSSVAADPCTVDVCGLMQRWKQGNCTASRIGGFDVFEDCERVLDCGSPVGRCVAGFEGRSSGQGAATGQRLRWAEGMGAMAGAKKLEAVEARSCGGRASFLRENGCDEEFEALALSSANALEKALCIMKLICPSCTN